MADQCAGRTTWWPCDAAEHDRELIVELGEVFGSDGPLLMRVMKDLAQARRIADAPECHSTAPATGPRAPST